MLEEKNYKRSQAKSIHTQTEGFYQVQVNTDPQQIQPVHRLPQTRSTQTQTEGIHSVQAKPDLQPVQPVVSLPQKKTIHTQQEDLQEVEVKNEPQPVQLVPQQVSDAAIDLLGNSLLSLPNVSVLVEEEERAPYVEFGRMSQPKEDVAEEKKVRRRGRGLKPVARTNILLRKIQEKQQDQDEQTKLWRQLMMDELEPLELDERNESALQDFTFSRRCSISAVPVLKIIQGRSGTIRSGIPLLRIEEKEEEDSIYYQLR